MRTVLAFLFAPATGMIVFAATGATFRDTGVGPTWLEAFGQLIVVSVFAFYGASYVFGTPFVCFLRARGCETPRNYTLSGALAGFVFFAVTLSLGKPEEAVSFESVVRRIAAAFAFAALGALVAASFAWISGVKKADMPSPAPGGRRT
jgi:hypothetical protein